MLLLLHRVTGLPSLTSTKASKSKAGPVSPGHPLPTYLHGLQLRRIKALRVCPSCDAALGPDSQAFLPRCGASPVALADSAATGSTIEGRSAQGVVKELVWQCARMYAGARAALQLTSEPLVAPRPAAGETTC